MEEQNGFEQNNIVQVYESLTEDKKDVDTYKHLILENTSKIEETFKISSYLHNLFNTDKLQIGKEIDAKNQATKDLQKIKKKLLLYKEKELEAIKNDEETLNKAELKKTLNNTLKSEISKIETLIQKYQNDIKRLEAMLCFIRYYSSSLTNEELEKINALNIKQEIEKEYFKMLDDEYYFNKKENYIIPISYRKVMELLSAFYK